MILTLSGTKIWRNLLGLKQNPKVVRLWRWKFAFEVFCASGQKRKKILMMLRDEKIFAFVCVSHYLTLSKISFDWKRNFNSTCFERKKIWRHFFGPNFFQMKCSKEVIYSLSGKMPFPLKLVIPSPALPTPTWLSNSCQFLWAKTQRLTEVPGC